MRYLRSPFIGAVLLLAMYVAGPMAQDSLTAVKELYASASYEEVLEIVARLDNMPPSTDRIELQRYRVFSLIALARTAEASQIIERIVSVDPLYVPDDSTTPPRVRTAIRDVRRRLLPDIARKEYVTAKASFDRKEFSGAAAELEHVIRIIDDPDVRETPELADLRVLVSGFRDLSRAAMRPPAPVTPAVPEAAESAPVAASAQQAGDSVASSSSETIVPPVPLRQDVPAWSSFGRQVQAIPYRGVLRITIDEGGNVESATIVLSIHPEYNGLLLEAAKKWRYLPANQGGKPVKFVKTLEIVLKP